MNTIASIAVVVEPSPVIDVKSVGVAGPPGTPGAPGPAGPAGPQGPAGTAGPHQATHAVGGSDPVTGPLALTAPLTAPTVTVADPALPIVAFSETAQSANNKNFRILGNSQSLYFQSTADNGDPVATALRLGRGGDASIGVCISVGVNPAQSGAVRLANEQPIAARNGANTGDLNIVKVRPWDAIVIGDAAASEAGFIVGGANVGLGAVNGSVTGFTWAVINTGAFQPAGDNAFNLGAPALRVKSLFLGTSANLKETPAPAVPAANEANVWCEDNGSGKTRLMVQFATGAAIQIAIQP